MRIVAIRDTLIPVGQSIANASIAFDQMTASAVAIVTDQTLDGATLVGYAFDSIGRYGKSGLLRERFIPRLLAAPPGRLLDHAGRIDPERCWRVMMENEKDGGHGERAGAIGLLDAALWDLRAKAERRPLWRSLADRYMTVGANGQIATYATCGHFRPGEHLDGLRTEIDRAIAAGYTRVKIKTGGTSLSDDLRRVDTAMSVLGAVRSPAAPLTLAVDVNGKLAAPLAEAYFGAMASLKIAWVEEPVAPLDFAALKRYAALSTAPIATGENLFSFDEARNLLRYGGLRAASDLVQIDVLLAYGIPEYVRILRLFEEAGWSRNRFYPHAGHLFAAHCVAGLRLGSAEAAADATLAYGGYWDGSHVTAGRLTLPELPGVGYEGKANLFAILAPLGRDN